MPDDTLKIVNGPLDLIWREVRVHEMAVDVEDAGAIRLPINDAISAATSAFGTGANYTCCTTRPVQRVTHRMRPMPFP